MCQDALNGSSRLRETLRASPPTPPTSSRPKPKAWVGCLCGTWGIPTLYGAIQGWTDWVYMGVQSRHVPWSPKTAGTGAK